jgi:hypothetical protein
MTLSWTKQDATDSKATRTNTPSLLRLESQDPDEF